MLSIPGGSESSVSCLLLSSGFRPTSARMREREPMHRESESRRRHHNSKSERDPRRDEKPGMEKSRRSVHAGGASKDGLDQKQRHRHPDASPLMSHSGPNFNVEEKGTNNKSSRNSTGPPRSRSYFQEHNGRGNTGRDARSSRLRTTDHGSWRASKDDQKRDYKDKERTAPEAADTDVQGKDTSSIGGDDNHVWRHDRLFEAQDDLPPPAKKRRPFREGKLLMEPQSTDRAVVQPTGSLQTDDRVEGHERKEERREQKSRRVDRNERDRRYGGERSLRSRVRDEKITSAYRDGYSGGGSGRYGELDSYGPGGGKVEKWKHDLFQEANRSPTPKNEEDAVAKVEALLAS